MIILFIPIGIAVGSFSYAVQRIAYKYSLNYGKIFHIFFCSALISLTLIGLRVRFRRYLLEFTRYIFLFFIILLLLFVCYLIFSILFRKVSHLNIHKRFGERTILSILIASLVLFAIAPYLYDYYLGFRFRYKQNNSRYPNIILIIMDTVRADALSCFQHDKNTTPNIDKIAGEGILFLKALSPAPWTPPSHASIFTGLYPSQHKVGQGLGHLDEEFLTLAEYLTELGYQTLGLSENPFVSKSSGLAQGFEDFYEMYSTSRKAVAPRLINKARKIFFNYRDTCEYARDTVKYFKRWIHKKIKARNSKPFFAFLNFMPAHLPNYPRPQFLFCRPSKEELIRIEPVNRVPERFYLPQYKLNERELNIMHSLYEGEIAYLDAKLGELFDFLKKKNIIDKTILIITSDHGENFGDHDLIEHHFCLYNSLLHIPLIIRYPAKIKPGSINNEWVSTIFLFHTIIDLINASGDKKLLRIEKRSLQRVNEDKHIYAEYGNYLRMLKNVISDEAPDDFNYTPFDRNMKCIYGLEYKFIWSSDDRRELYNMNKDWQEKQNLVSEKEVKFNILNHQLKNWQKALWKPTLVKKAKKMDKETEEALKALGYIK